MKYSSATIIGETACFFLFFIPTPLHREPLDVFAFSLHSEILPRLPHHYLLWLFQHIPTYMWGTPPPPPLFFFIFFFFYFSLHLIMTAVQNIFQYFSLFHSLNRAIYFQSMLNHSKFTCSFMHHRVQRSKILYSARRVYLCVPYGSQNKWRSRTCKTLTDWSF